MPLSEYCRRMGKEKIEAAQQKSTTCATDLSFLPDNEFVELVWENGQIMMQGQSSKVRKSPVSSSFQLHTPRIRERDIGNATTSKMGKFGSIESIFSDIAVSGPSDEMGLNQDYDMVPWLNYPVDDYCSELLPELSSVTVNEPSTRNNFSLIDCDQTVKDSRNGASLEQGNASIPSLGSGVSDLISSNTRKKMQNEDSGRPTINSTLLNFSHFLRPAATATATATASASARANLHNIVSVETMRVNDKGSSASSSKHAKSKLIDPNNGLEKEMDFHSQAKLLSAKVDSKPLVTNPLEECQEDAVKIDISPNQALGGSATKGVPESEKTVEPVIASSSVCSGNIVGRASNDLTKNLKRKCVDTEESEWQSDDVEEESVVVKKATCARGGTGSKRSRAAEVHNLSERRRRDRINEKMRALQELIPNCNKVDKSSMLDEAIEYLKTLQLQVQIMSMGAGLYMPPMMLPTGMQHIHAPHLPHFSPMGVGMRMGMGMGMGMGFGMGSHFPFPSAPTAFQGIGGSNLMGFGHPAQGLPVAVSGSPFVPLSARPPINSGVGLNASRMGVHVDISNATPRLNPKGLIQNSNSPVMDNADASTSMQQTSSQFQATNEGFDQSDLLQKNDRVPDLGGSAAVNQGK